MDTANLPNLIRTKALCRQLGTTYPTIFRWMQDGKFPEPIKLSDGSLAWYESEVLEWLQSRPRQKYGKRRYEDA